MNFPEHDGTSPTTSYETTSPSTNIGPFTDEEHAVYMIQRVVHANKWPDYNMSGRTPDQIEAHATHHFKENDKDHGQLFEEGFAKDVAANKNCKVGESIVVTKTHAMLHLWSREEDELYLKFYTKYGRTWKN
jgi:hypothetical protein